MKNFKKFLSVLLVASIAPALFSCGEDDDGDIPVYQMLSAPSEIYYSAKNSQLMWDTVSNAVSYKIKINNQENSSAVTTNTFNYTVAANSTVTFAVKAIAGEKPYLDSDWSSTYTYTNVPSTITNQEIETALLSFRFDVLVDQVIGKITPSEVVSVNYTTDNDGGHLKAYFLGSDEKGKAYFAHSFYNVSKFPDGEVPDFTYAIKNISSLHDSQSGATGYTSGVDLNTYYVASNSYAGEMETLRAAGYTASVVKGCSWVSGTNNIDCASAGLFKMVKGSDIKFVFNYTDFDIVDSGDATTNITTNISDPSKRTVSVSGNPDYIIADDCVPFLNYISSK